MSCTIPGERNRSPSPGCCGLIRLVTRGDELGLVTPGPDDSAESSQPRAAASTGP